MAVLVSNDQDLLLLLLTFYDTQGVEQVIEPCYMLYRDGGTRRTTPPTVKINIYRGRKKKPVTHSLLSFKRALFGQQQHRCSEVARLQNSVDSSSNENKFKGKKKKKKKKETSGGLMPCWPTGIRKRVHLRTTLFFFPFTYTMYHL